MHEVVDNGGAGDLNGDDCDDGIECNGAETCQGATVIACEGICVGGDPITAGQPCIRATDCIGGGVCTGKVCAGTGAACNDNIECGSAVGTCQPGTPIDCTLGGQVCDENGDSTAICVPPCVDDAGCDDGITCNGVEVCEPSGLCSSPGNPCGQDAALCLEKKCLQGGPGITNTPCETFNDCVPTNPNSCGTNGPYCFFGRCCDSNATLIPNVAFAGCDPNSWYAGDNGSIVPGATPPCPVYGGGIGARLSDAQEFFATVGPTSLSPFPNAYTNSTLHKLGDDYAAVGAVPGVENFIALQYFRFAGGVSSLSNSRISFEFYDVNGNFVEDVFFPAARNVGGIQSVNVLNLAPSLKIPDQGFIVGHVLQSFGSITAPGEFFWISTDATDQGTNDPNVLYIANNLGAPSSVPNFLGVCAGGANDGIGCSTIAGAAADCPGGTCNPVPGVLAFELEGPTTPDAPRGGCCEPVSGACNELLIWECLGSGGNYLGDNIACASCANDSSNPGAACRTCSDTGLACTGAADCPTGTCDLNDSVCGRVCDDFLTPCASDADCAGIGNGLCGGGCQLNSSCGTGSCCIPSTGECQEDHTASTCATLGGTFQGLGTDCDPDCCVQPVLSGADNCESAPANIATIPSGAVCQQGPNNGLACSSTADCAGNPCERTVVLTVTGDNSSATSTFPAPDSCFPPNDAPGAELGWFEKITIVDPAVRADDTIGCGYLLVDHCCTNPVKIPAYRILYDNCPCGDTIFTKPNPNHPDRDADARGAPFCTLDNAWQQFGPLTAGDYWYPILSFLGGNFDQYQFHIRVEACPDAVCCVGSNCKIVNILECQDAGGSFLAPPNQSVGETFCTGQCGTGSCCTGPGECVDNEDPQQNSQIDMTQTFCENSLFGTYVGGRACFGGVCQSGTRVGQSCQIDSNCPGSVCVGDSLQLAQPSPCPVCETLGPNNCQANDDSVAQRGSDLGLPGGGVHVADDFIPLTPQIDSVCVWGVYSQPDADGAAVDCSAGIQDDFRIRVYAADATGMPDVNNVVAEVSVGPSNIVKKIVPNSSNEILAQIPLYAYQLDISATPITGLDASGATCDWLEVVNTLDGTCFWGWQTVDTANNDFSAIGGNGSYGPSSARNRDMAFCLSTDFLSGACGTPVGYCCTCDGTCTDENRRDCLATTSRWRIEDTCGTFTCEAGPPANDLCDNVVANVGVITPVVEGTVRFDNTCSNSDGNNNGVCSELGDVAQISGDIWYTFIAPEDGVVTFSTCAVGPASGGGIDTIIMAFRDDANPTQCRCPSTVDNGEDNQALAAWITDPPHTAGGCGITNTADENCDGVLNGAGGFISGDATAGDCFLIRVGGFPGQGSEEGAGTITITLQTGNAPPPPPPVDMSSAGDHGQRYLEISAAAGSVGPEVIRVKPLSTPGMTGAPTALYVSTPYTAPDGNTADPGKTFTAAQLVCDPVATDFSVFTSIAVYGAEVIPSKKTALAQYQIQRASASCPNLTTDETCWSTPLVVTQGVFGDVVIPFYSGSPGVFPDFKDISAYVNKFLGDPTVPSKAELQLGPNLVRPTVGIDFKDISRDVGSFLGGDFETALGITGFCTCPSSVTCGAVACTADNQCGAGELCIDGGCVDGCGRCTP